MKKKCCDEKGFKCPTCLSRVISYNKLETLQDDEDKKFYDILKLTCTKCDYKWSISVPAGYIERGMREEENDTN